MPGNESDAMARKPAHGVEDMAIGAPGLRVIAGRGFSAPRRNRNLGGAPVHFRSAPQNHCLYSSSSAGTWIMPRPPRRNARRHQRSFDIRPLDRGPIPGGCAGDKLDRCTPGSVFRISGHKDIWRQKRILLAYSNPSDSFAVWLLYRTRSVEKREIRKASKIFFHRQRK